ncbi:YhdP family protein [Gluconobacter morbifer]|uniref:AsmA-like C-terminal domain-containing protein n=1 Tax=Gluconobacter morbifer G707 TaxID=1088869 RepID=G6XFU0_9PROT|nr:AsmA-like C-terminal region-containing protein [Gluconobacter morbifer]EHH69048.1 hypothetical protein GMO_03550 [Gluconobacter morbifer G707]
MGVPETYRPGPHFPRHLHIARWVAIALAAPVALMLGAGSIFLWKLTQGPVDVTRVSSFFEPVVIAAGQRRGHPAGRVTWKQLQIQWRPGSHGVSAGLMLEAHGLRTLRYDDTVASYAEEADTVLWLGALLRGAIAPRRLRLRNANFSLRRMPNGDVEFDLPEQKTGGQNGTPVWLDRLTELDIHNVTVTLSGLPHDRTARIGPVEIHARRRRQGLLSRDYMWTGEGRIPLALDAFQTVLSLKGEQVGKVGQWQVTGTPFRPSDLGLFNPLAGDWNVPVSLSATATVVPHRLNELPQMLTLQMALGDGMVSQKKADPVHVQAGSVRLQVNMARAGLSGPALVQVPSARLTVMDSRGAATQVHASAWAKVDDLRHPVMLDGEAEAGLDGLDFATLGSVWPESLIRGGRRWISKNITSGTARDMEVKAHLHTGSGLDDLKPVSVVGHVSGHDMTVHWLRPIAPATGLEADLRFDGPETLVIALGHGRQPDGKGGMIRIPDGEVRIGQLYAKDQTGDIRTHLQGSLPSFMSVLAHPRLHLLSKHPLPFTDPAGDVDSHVRLTLPLTAHIPDGQIHVHAQAGFARVHLGHVLMGRPVDGAKGTLAATENGLDLTGDGRLAGIPVHVGLNENFSGGAQDRVLQKIDVRAFLDPQSAAQARIGPAGLFAGHAVLDAHYLQKANAQADLGLGLDLAKAGITVPIWTKAPGESAQAMAHIAFRHGVMTAIDGLRAQGRDLSIMGRGVTLHGGLAGIVLEGFRVGRTQGDAEITLPKGEADPIGVSVNANPLDLAPLFMPHPAIRKPPPAPERSSSQRSSMGDSWTIDLRAPHVFYGPKGQVGDVVSHLELRKGILRSGRFSLDRPARVRAVLADAGRDHPFVLDIDNLGQLLLGLGLYDRIRGGQTHLDGRFTPDLHATHTAQGRDAKLSGLGGGLPPFEGHVEMGPSEFLRPPLGLTAVSDLSPLHWLNSHMDRFQIDRLSTRLTLVGRLLTLHDGVIGNQALGATVEGPINLDTSALRLRGTIIPLFGLNVLPGQLPGLGKLLTPEKGGGLLAVTFGLHGTVENPKLQINPLSMLLPGVLRRIFQ